jgi:PLP dependent protein
MTERLLFPAITDRIARFRQTIPASVRIIAVTKTVSSDVVRAAYEAGLRDFGENQIQVAERKQAELADLTDITWHFIGHLQTNKAKRALELFPWIHSIDSLKLAERLNRLAADRATNPQICLQVKLLPDPNKSGWQVSELLADLPALSACEHLDIRGLMTIAPLGLSDTELLALFQKTHDLMDQLRQQQLPRLQLDQLSMGMSDDYLLAIQAGATMIRPGRILFA